MKRLQYGILIVFEGIDGTGKSTQLRLLHTWLEERGYDVVATREPTKGQYGQKIRSLYLNRGRVTPEEELELFLLDRRDHVENLILPALRDGRIVLCDRYFLSTIAYQGAAGMDPEAITRRNGFAPQPDIAFLFSLCPAASVKRITQTRGDVLNDFEQEEYLRRVEMIFNSLKFPYIQTIDADRSVEAVHEDVRSAVVGYLQRILDES